MKGPAMYCSVLLFTWYKINHYMDLWRLLLLFPWPSHRGSCAWCQYSTRTTWKRACVSCYFPRNLEEIKPTPENAAVAVPLQNTSHFYLTSMHFVMSKQPVHNFYEDDHQVVP